jgi:hypothetical protein
MIPKVFFDKTVFVKFKISNKFERKIDETDLKLPKLYRKIHTSILILKKAREKIRELNFLETSAKSLWFPQKNPYPGVWI